MSSETISNDWSNNNITHQPAYAYALVHSQLCKVLYVREVDAS